MLLGLRPQYIGHGGPAGLPPAMPACQSPSNSCSPPARASTRRIPLGGTSIVADLAAHDVSKPGEKTHIDIDMTRAIVIDPATEQVI